MKKQIEELISLKTEYDPSKKRRLLTRKNLFSFFFVAMMVIGLSGCVTDPDSSPLEQDSSDEQAADDTVVPEDSDTTVDLTNRKILAFKENLYPVVVERCGMCHANVVEPNFAHADVETAYTTINSMALVDFDNSVDSRLVEKILTEHICSNPICLTWSTELQGGINGWAAAVAELNEGVGNNDGADNNDGAGNNDAADNNDGAGNNDGADNNDGVGNNDGADNNDGTDNNNDDVVNDDGAGNNDNSGNEITEEQFSAFETHLYPILVEQCGTCHSSIVTPNFTHEDVATAYSVVISNTLVNLSNPANSRLVVKPLTLHKCTLPTCQVWADAIETGVTAWANTLDDSEIGAGVSGSSVMSKAMTLADGVKDEGAGRVEDAIIARYDFKTGTGTTAFDTSGVAPALDLTLSEDVKWISGQGIDIVDPNAAEASKAVATREASKKLYDKIAGPDGSQQYTIEAWLINASVALDGPARIVSYSQNTGNRNFTMGQNTSYYNFRNRTDLTGNNGSSPTLETDNDADDLKTQLQHVVFTFDTVNGRKIFVNGLETAYENTESDPSVPADISNWDDSYTFILGNEIADNVKRQWLGRLLFVGIHNRALTADEVLNNALEGIGDKFILEFDVSTLLDASGETSSKVSVVVSELDEFSYVFATPTLLTNITSPNIPVKNIRIAVNGNVPAAAQAFRNIDIVALSDNTKLSTLAAVIPKDTGSDTDEFSLIFEVLGNNSNIVVEQNPAPVVDLSVNDPSPEYGLRTFEQLNNTMSVLTGVDKRRVSETYKILEQQLPGTPNLGSFVSSNQIGIAKLSLEYCDAMVESETLRTEFFGNTFEFTSAVSVAFSDQTKRNIIIDNVVNKMVGVNLSTQPSLAEIKPDLDQLIDELSVNCNVAGDCNADRTRTIVKSVCASVLASAAISID